ncbi:phosphatases II [Basidiobolus meristosporus CBS 931.73]|uniref:protein-tyrosine-phosphatase n=1 Tax=Basidiobolus meristosporus CBS 931.73 TaxID=1314790 RepID=A0A1Y1XWF9_9FUNG|nr:phosphatases II [Basidiobolus meristosporus CBS 931.73]|eukprot:ORX90090.1 phosphatases II [Basidiobolus meristosporus CBS 931.73]
MTLAFSKPISTSPFPSLAKKPPLRNKRRNSKNLSLIVPKGCGATETSGKVVETPTTSITQQVNQLQIAGETSPGQQDSYNAGPICILPFLFLGCEKNARDQEMLVTNDIHYILNVAKEVDPPYFEGVVSPTTPSIVSYTLQLDGDCLADPTRILRYKSLAWGHNEENIFKSFQDAFRFIDEARSKQLGILVHCQLGVSRSASLMIAYVMRALRMNVNEAYDYVKSRSDSICPNMSLICQLVELEESLDLNSNLGIAK